MADERRTLEYTPPWAPHVTSSYPERGYDEQTGGFDEQKIDMACGECGARHRVTCTSGQARLHVEKFALVHLHRDALRDPYPGKSPGEA